MAERSPAADTFIYISFDWVLFAGIHFHYFITINGAEESHNSQGRSHGADSAVKIFRTFVIVKGSAYLFIHLFGRSCALAFRCVSLSIQQSGSPDLGCSREPRLLTTIKLTGADVTVLHFHTVQRLRRGHVER